MRRLALLSLIVAAVLIPGGARAEGRSISPGSKTSGSIEKGAGVDAKVGSLSKERGFQRFSRFRDIQSVRQLRGMRVMRQSPFRPVGIAITWLLIVTIVGFVLMALGPGKLEIVIATIQKGVGKSLVTGLVGQMAIVPGAIAVVVLLAVTLVGLVLITLGLMGLMIVAAGIAMFGFIAVATMTGAALTGGKTRDETPHGKMLRAFLTGSALYMGLWLITAALSGVPLLGAMLESFSAAVTFIAVTTGFGAVILSYWRGEFKEGASPAV